MRPTGYACVGKSGNKSRLDLNRVGGWYETQRLANDRFRVELHTNDLDIDAVMERAKTISLDTLPAQTQHDSMSSSLAKASALIERYPSKLRTSLYCGLCASNGNGWQLVESFPWLAVRIFVVEDTVSNSARHLVKRGAKLRDIAEAVGVPMCFKRFSPKATDRLMDLSGPLSRNPDVVSHHCPEKEREQVSWLIMMAKAYESGNEDFAIWVAIHWKELSDETPHWVSRALGDLNDWVRDCSIEQVSHSIEADDVEKIYQAMLSTSAESAENLRAWWQSITGAAVAGRLFNKAMKPETVLRLSEEWHERAAVTKAADVEFPEPWYEGGDIGDYRIEPIRTAPDLSRYAFRLHNCATSYTHDVARGKCFLYVVLQEDNPKAMVELKRDDEGTVLSQLKGPCNQYASEELEAAVNTWLEAA